MLDEWPMSPFLIMIVMHIVEVVAEMSDFYLGERKSPKYSPNLNIAFD